MRLGSSYLIIAIVLHGILFYLAWNKRTFQTTEQRRPLVVWKRAEPPKSKKNDDQFRYLDQSDNNRPTTEEFESKTAAMSDEYRKGQKPIPNTKSGAQGLPGERSSGQQSTKPSQTPSIDLKSLVPTINPMNAFQRTQTSATNLAPGGGGQNGDGVTPETIKTLYYSYWRRLESRISPRWERMIRDRLESGVRPGVYETIVSFVIHEDGSFNDISIEGESNIRDFDLAASRAIQGASPTPNPPKEMILNELNTLKIKFVVQVASGSGITIRGVENAADPFAQ